MRRAILASSALLLSALAADAADRVDYVKQVKPILAHRCTACHGALQQQAGLRLDTAKFMTAGGDNGPAVEPGKIDESLLIERVLARGSRRMPPPSDGEGLKPAEIALIKAWVEQGAAAPSDEQPEPDPREHWAFRTPVRPALPKVTQPRSPIRNPIDAFLAVAWEKPGIVPQPPADRRLLLRRLYLDLIGLPPTRAELDAFVADTSPDAYEKVVDRLLASPQYAERWGRHWMDIWRYSDWWGLGAEVRNSQKHIWHWRDWILDSLNADKGYDQMLREMLAADEMYPNDLEKLRATGFLVRPYFIFNRTTWLDEVIEHTGKGMLGLTLNCSKCHDHKYDPIGQQDYYRFRAFFEPYHVRTEQLPGESDLEKNGLPRVFDFYLDTPTYLHVRGDDRNPDKRKALAPGVPPLLAIDELAIAPVSLPAESHAPQVRPYVLDNLLKAAEEKITASRAEVEKATRQLAEAEKSKPAQAAAIPAEPTLPGETARPKVLAADNFASPKPELWQTMGGKWKHANGKLSQEENEGRAVLKLKTPPPSDFQARFKFTVTGGTPYRSIGVCFDAGEGREVLVYASASDAGSKVQIAYQQNGGGHVYPTDGMLARLIKLGEPLELTIRARGTLVNVAVNGEHALAYTLPIPRKSGDLLLITFTALADFQAFELQELPPSTVLVAAGPLAKSDGKLTVPQARAALIAAEKALAAAEAQPAALRARAAADRAKHEKAENAKPLATDAAKAERQAALRTAEENLARAEAELLRAAPGKPTTDATAKRDAAKKTVETATQALTRTDETYTPLNAAVRAPQLHQEGLAARTTPFPDRSTGRRTALARWITDSRHPLTARVAVNHIWARHFGKPLVETVFDFGRKGARPTHPQLLDWLACELMDNHWSMKHLHKLMVMSEAYRRSSSAAHAAPATLAADPENRLYWRMNPIRMEAQVVRDSLLHLAGELDLTLGGPSIPINDDASRRRSLYYVHSHNDHQRFLSMFDDADVKECYRRAESIVPVQALALSNSRFALTQAGKINNKLHAELGNLADSQFVRAAFEAILGGAPTVAEQAACEESLRQLTDLLRKQGIPDASRRARGDLVSALLNHNDFVTIR